MVVVIPTCNFSLGLASLLSFEAFPRGSWGGMGREYIHILDLSPILPRSSLQVLVLTPDSPQTEEKLCGAVLHALRRTTYHWQELR